jgi:hypothetical protein
MTTGPDSRNATEAGGTRSSLDSRVPSPGWGRFQVSVDADMRLCESCCFVWLQADESGAEGEVIDGSGHIRTGRGVERKPARRGRVPDIGTVKALDPGEARQRLHRSTQHVDFAQDKREQHAVLLHTLP